MRAAPKKIVGPAFTVEGYDSRNARIRDLSSGKALDIQRADAPELVSALRELAENISESYNINEGIDSETYDD